MKITLIAIATGLSLTAFIIINDNDTAFKKLYTLEGTWKMNSRHGAVCEEWKKMDKNYLQNRGYIIKGTDTIVTERVALTKTAEGIFYTSTVEDQNNPQGPVGKQPIAFKMTKAENNMFVFENREHDFPKRIVYKLVTSDSLYAYIDDGIDGSKKRQDFYYRKIKK